MKLRMMTGMSVLAVAGIWSLTGISAEPQPNQVKDFMRVKLVESQKVLEGLALEDFDLIAKNAQAMSLLSQESNWKVLQTEEYLRHSQDFQRTADAIRDAAKKKNLDGAALGYVELTMKCIQCHKYVRDTRMAAAPARKPVLSR
jgi:hypothetical protein